MLSQLREIVGTEPLDDTLMALLTAHRHDVTAAANAYFDGAARAPITGTPVAPPPPPEANLLQCTVPAGMFPGQELRVETDAGPMRVTIPAGVGAGDVFLVRPPSVARRQQTIPTARPVGSSQQAYPGLQHQPNVTYVQPNVTVVQQPVHYARPYGYGGYGYGYGGYGYGYGDPFLATGVGLLGVMLIADALFW